MSRTSGASSLQQGAMRQTNQQKVRAQAKAETVGVEKAVDREIPPMPVIASTRWTVTPNQPQELTLPVPSSKEFAFSLAPETPGGRLEIGLTDPRGQAVSLRAAGSYPGLTVQSTYLGEALVSIKNPAQGDWKIRVNSKDKEAHGFIGKGGRSVRFCPGRRDRQTAICPF